MKVLLLFLLVLLRICSSVWSTPAVSVGAEQLMTDGYMSLLKGKRIGLITNHTAVTSQMQPTFDLLKTQEKQGGYEIVALFAPEHGINGMAYASGYIQDDSHGSGIPVYSLHGNTRRPTDKMLAGVNLLIFDIQDIGSRSYTYISTLFYVMEEAAKRQIPVFVLDRPNPINGHTIDGPMLREKWRSFLGYVNIPYCHGMTIGELAMFFNAEYNVGCKLRIIPMKGWKRRMSFQETGLGWIPTSPNIPEASTVYYYPSTGLIGELGLLNIGIGYTLPFKVVGAPWLDADRLAKALNKQNCAGIQFVPFHYRPFFGKFAQEDCHGVLLVITNTSVYKPISTQYTIIGIIKGLYPREFKKALEDSKQRYEIFCKANGTDEVYQLLMGSKSAVWPLRMLHQKERDLFSTLRKKYLLPDYVDN